MNLQKSPRYLNPKLLALAKGLPCQHCGIEMVDKLNGDKNI